MCERSLALPITETFRMGMSRSEIVRCLREVVPLATLMELTTTPIKTNVARSETGGFARQLIKPPDPDRILEALVTTRQAHGFQ